MRGVRLTCPPVRLSLTPKTREFYVLFARAGDNALEVARLVERRFREHPHSGITQEQVKAAETRGDGVTRELIRLLNTQYEERSKPQPHGRRSGPRRWLVRLADWRG